MKIDGSERLSKYRSLIFLSLVAQSRDDVAQEDRLIDALDVVWAQMSNDERHETEVISKEAAAWFSAKEHLDVQEFVGRDISSVVTVSQSYKLSTRIAEKSVGDISVFKKMKGGWEPRSFAQQSTARTNSFGHCAVA